MSRSAERVWKPRLGELAALCTELTWLSVRHGVRACCIASMQHDDISRMCGRWADDGLQVLPLDDEVRQDGGVLDPLQLSVAIGSTADLEALAGALRSGRHDEIGELLGYPACCIEWFVQARLSESDQDPIWNIARSAVHPNADMVEVLPPDSVCTNVLWHTLGLRVVPHWPCRFDCQASASLGEAVLRAAVNGGYHQAATWLGELLRWPVEWSSLHGLVEVRTPILRLVMPSRAVGTKRTVRWMGTAVPLEAARGTAFPWSRSLPLTSGGG